MILYCISPGLQPFQANIYGKFKITREQDFCFFPLVYPAVLWYIGSKDTLKKELKS